MTYAHDRDDTRFYRYARPLFTALIELDEEPVSLFFFSLSSSDHRRICMTDFCSFRIVQSVLRTETTGSGIRTVSRVRIVSHSHTWPRPGPWFLSLLFTLFCHSAIVGSGSRH